MGLGDETREPDRAVALERAHLGFDFAAEQAPDTVAPRRRRQREHLTIVVTKHERDLGVRESEASDELPDVPRFGRRGLEKLASRRCQRKEVADLQSSSRRSAEVLGDHGLAAHDANVRADVLASTARPYFDHRHRRDRWQRLAAKTE